MLTDYSNEIRGQSSLVNKIDSLNLNTFPHSLLLLGEQGCGKHLISNYISMHLGVEIKTIDNKITAEDVENIMLRPYPCIYLIELDSMLPKAQNSLLKLIEEPLAGTFILGISCNQRNVIPTILNRCQKWYFERYSKEVLSSFIREEKKPLESLLLDIFSTPGQLLEAQDNPVEDILKLADTILSRLSNASLSNVLTISDKIAFKEEKDKFNLNIFIKVLNYKSREYVVNFDQRRYYKMFELISSLSDRLNWSISKPRSFDGFLVELWEASKEC